MDYKNTRDQIKQLMKAGQYQSALQMTLALKRQYPQDAGLHKLINTLKEGIKGDELRIRDDFIKKGLQTIQGLKKEGRLEEAIKACSELLEVDPENRKGRRLIKKLKQAFIGQQLNADFVKQWEEKNEYEKLYLFYQRLRNIFPKHKKLNRLLKKTEARMIEQDKKNKATFAQTSLEKLRKLYKEGEFERVILGAEDLIHYTHKGSTEAKKLWKAAQEANRREIEKETDQYMMEQTPVLKAAYESGEAGIIKI